MKSVLDALREPALDRMDVDGAERLELHRKVLGRKRMLQVVFKEFHHLFQRLNDKYLDGAGLELEIGAGVAPMRETYPNVLATDIVESPHLDRAINAEAMELESNSVRAIYGQNCFHHFPHPERFFQELERVLVLGGGAILLEPYYGPAATFLFKRLFRTEGFDKAFPDWNTPVKGPMNGANQALSYIVFVRDRALFEKRFPSLRVVHQAVVPNYLKYLLSGGLNFKQLLPNSLIPTLSFIERLLTPFDRFLALHHVVVIKKVSP